MADYNIGAMSGLGSFATALPGALDEWIKQNEQQRQFEAQGRLAAALAPFQEEMAKSQAVTGRAEAQMAGSRASYLAQALGGQPSQGPMSEIQRSAIGLKGRDPQVVMQEKLFVEQLKQAGLLEKGKQLIQAREESQRKLMGEREAATQRRPSLSQVLGGIVQAKLEGKMTPEMDAAWRMAHPVEGKIIDQVEKSLMGNDAYKMAVASGDVATAMRMRQDTTDRIMGAYGVSTSAPEELGESEEIMTTEDEAMMSMIMKALGAAQGMK
jgi:hypothetical protein